MYLFPLINTTVSVLKELTFSSFSDTSFTKEIQTVNVNTEGYFRFGLYGVYTGNYQNRLTLDSFIKAISVSKCSELFLNSEIVVTL